MTERQILALDNVSPEPTSGCWLWLGGITKRGYGYGQFKGKQYRVHRAFYEVHKGPIPEGLELDHKCCIKCCVNPDHLEPVTKTENLRRCHVMGRSKAARLRSITHCKKGHEFTGANTAFKKNGTRRCMECSRAQSEAWRTANRKRRAA